MNFQFYLEKLFASDEFQKFKSENPDAFLCSCFFAIDKKGKDNKTHFDYYIPSTKKLFSFQLDSGCTLLPVDQLDKNWKPSKISDNHNFDSEEIENMITEKIKAEKIKNTIEKMLLSLQKVDGTEYLAGTIFLSQMALIQVKINLDKKEIEEFKKKTFFDMIKITGKK